MFGSTLGLYIVLQLVPNNLGGIRIDSFPCMGLKLNQSFFGHCHKFVPWLLPAYLVGRSIAHRNNKAWCSVCVMVVYFSVILGDPTVWYVSDILLALGNLFLLLDCLIQPWDEGLCQTLLDLFVLCSVDKPGRPDFLMLIFIFFFFFWGETEQ